MARLKTMAIGMLNITAHPHSPQTYKRLFQDTYRNDYLGKIWGSDYGVIGSCSENSLKDGTTYLYGTIYKFLNIDPKAEWFDIKKRTTIDPEEEGTLAPIPENLKPNCKPCIYIFFLKNHRMVFESAVITPSRMKKLLDDLFFNEEIKSQYGQVDITVESTEEAIKQIISIPRLTKLQIDLKLPNGDTLSDEEEEVLERLRKRRARRHVQVFSSTEEKGIAVDRELETTMKLARSNGKVVGTGYDGETRVVKSTSMHPLIERTQYDPDRESILNAMLYAATGILSKF